MAYRLLRVTARRVASARAPRRYYQQELDAFAEYGIYRFLVASHEGEPLAINISAAFGSRAAYIHGASSDRHRALMPNYLLMWEAMRWAERSRVYIVRLVGHPGRSRQVCVAVRNRSGHRVDGWVVGRVPVQARLQR